MLKRFRIIYNFKTNKGLTFRKKFERRPLLICFGVDTRIIIIFNAKMAFKTIDVLLMVEKA